MVFILWQADQAFDLLILLSRTELSTYATRYTKLVGNYLDKN